MTTTVTWRRWAGRVSAPLAVLVIGACGSATAPATPSATAPASTPATVSASTPASTPAPTSSARTTSASAPGPAEGATALARYVDVPPMGPQWTPNEPTSTFTGQVAAAWHVVQGGVERCRLQVAVVGAEPSIAAVEGNTYLDSTLGKPRTTTLSDVAAPGLPPTRVDRFVHARVASTDGTKHVQGWSRALSSAKGTLLIALAVTHSGYEKDECGIERTITQLRLTGVEHPDAAG